jgi:putative hydrolase of the HAD superfamily
MNVVFDFGAILFEWQPAALLTRHFPQRAASVEQAGQLARDFFQHSHWHDFDCGLRDINEVIGLAAQRLELPLADVEAMVGVIGQKLSPIARNVEVLDGLRRQRDAGADLRLFFLSNMPAPYSRELERRHDFLNWFDGGIFSGDVKLGKPDPAIFLLLAQRHGLAPAETLFIDDLLVNVQAAEALGWQGLHCEAPELLAGKLAARLAAFAA